VYILKKVDCFFSLIIFYTKNQVSFAGLKIEDPNHSERLLLWTPSRTIECFFYFLPLHFDHWYSVCVTVLEEKKGFNYIVEHEKVNFY